MSPGLRRISKLTVEYRGPKAKERERIWQEILPLNNETKQSCLPEIYLIFIFTLKDL